MTLLDRLERLISTDTANFVLAGTLGGVVRWVTLKERPRDGLASLIVGAISAAYVGPLVAPVIEPVFGRITGAEGSTGLSAFLVGIGGVSLSAFLVELFRKNNTPPAPAPAPEERGDG